MSCTRTRRPRDRRIGPTWILPLIGLLAAVPIAGCGASESGLASKSAAEILAASQAAAHQASSVHVSGGFAQGPVRSTLALDLARGRGGQGTVTVGPIRVEAVLIGSTLYLKGLGGGPASTWVKTEASGGHSFSSTVDQTKLLNSMLGSRTAPTKGTVTNVDGQQVIELKEGGAQLFNEVLYVAVDGEPYPVALRKVGRESGEVHFSGWNEAVRLSPPANAVEERQRGSGG
jgi:hypothetical protein